MSHTNTTTNYGLPLFVSTDKPAWLVDFNGAMNTIDTTVHDADVTAQGANDKADTVTANLATANQNIATLQQTAVTQGTQVNANSTSISNLNSSLVALAEPVLLQKSSAESATVALLSGNKLSDYKMIAVALLYQGSVRAVTYYPKSSFLSYSVYAYAGTYIGSATYVSDTSVTLSCSNTSWETRLLGYK